MSILMGEGQGKVMILVEGGQEVEDVTEDIAGKAGMFLSSSSWAE
jgi:hypothetical protein